MQAIRLVFVTLVLLAGLVFQAWGATPGALSAGFTFSPGAPVAGQTVQFTDTSKGNPTSWSWSFGDGTTSTARNPVHIYVTAGTFTVTLKVRSTWWWFWWGSTTTAIGRVTVGQTAPPPPAAGFTFSPAAPTTGQTVTFTDTSTGSPTSWSWTFGDGGVSTSQNPTHAYATAGTYTVTLKATNAGGSGTASKNLTVATGGKNEPKSCTVPSECTGPGACPPDAAKGCTCSQNRCVPQCSTTSDCPKPPDKTLVCSAQGLCVPDGGTNPDTGMNIDDTISDEAQSMTIAFDGLSFVTGNFCAQTFYPPGKVADFFGFQHLRDNDPTGMGHNTEFTTLTADPVLAMLSDAQLKILADLGNVDAPLGDAYALARFPLARAFRRLYDATDLPTGKTALDVNAVKAYSAYLFGIDGEMTYLRAQAYASVLTAMTGEQKAKLALVKNGATSTAWAALQPSNPSVIPAILKKFPTRGDLRTYAGEMLSWYVGGVDPDVYFCPERQGTYFGSFFMKDIKAMHNPNYTIDSNMTAEMGNTFLATLDATTQRPKITGLVDTQKADLLAIVEKREEISTKLRTFLAAGSPSKAEIVALAEQYGALDGEISYFYATAFSSLGLSTAQKATLMAERKKATAEDDGSADYDNTCGNGYLYSAPLSAPPTIINTDFMFGVCSAAGTACTSDWNCCSYDCTGNTCAVPFSFTSPAFQDGGSLSTIYTCDGTGGGHSPALLWSGPPAGTVEFALTVTTIALDGTKYNWVLFHIPAATTALSEAVTGVGTTGVSTDGPELRYYPPCSTGPGDKTYTFTLYALSGTPTFAVPESQVTGPILMNTISPLIIESRRLNVTYARQGL